MKKRKTALVTGATSGIGRELSELFAGDGYNLILVARNQVGLEDTAEQLRKNFNVPVMTVAQDLSLPTSPEAIFKLLQENSMHVDILVNNAGFNEYGPFWETDLSQEIRMIQLNITSLTHLTKLLLPGMLERKDGKILNVGSTGSFAPGPYNAVYCATKAYILSFSEAIGEELEGSGVTVTTLCPGVTKTDFARRANMEKVKIFQGQLMEAKKVAQIGYHALFKGRKTVIAGCANIVTILSLRFAPRTMVAKLAKSLMSMS